MFLLGFVKRVALPRCACVDCVRQGNSSPGPVDNGTYSLLAAVAYLGTQLPEKGPVVKEYRIVHGLLVRLQLPGIAIALKVVPEAEAYRGIRVGIPQPEEVLMAYPSVLAIEPSIDCLHEGLRHHGVDVVDVHRAPLAGEHGGVCDRTASAEQVVEMLRRRHDGQKLIDYP